MADNGSRRERYVPPHLRKAPPNLSTRAFEHNPPILSPLWGSFNIAHINRHNSSHLSEPDILLGHAFIMDAAAPQEYLVDFTDCYWHYGHEEDLITLFCEEEMPSICLSKSYSKDTSYTRQRIL